MPPLRYRGIRRFEPRAPPPGRNPVARRAPAGTRRWRRRNRSLSPERCSGPSFHERETTDAALRLPDSWRFGSTPDSSRPAVLSNGPPRDPWGGPPRPLRTPSSARLCGISSLTRDHNSGRILTGCASNPQTPCNPEIRTELQDGLWDRIAGTSKALLLHCLRHANRLVDEVLEKTFFRNLEIHEGETCSSIRSWLLAW